MWEEGSERYDGWKEERQSEKDDGKVEDMVRAIIIGPSKDSCQKQQTMQSRRERGSRAVSQRNTLQRSTVLVAHAACMFETSFHVY